jgi:dTDP-4-amino-4,6-dideoxygalactose transaminase
MSNITAGIGRGQMLVLNDRISQRRKNFEFYKKALSGFAGISFLEEQPNSFANRWLTCILVDPILTGGISREDIRIALEKENIECRRLWKPMHMQPVFEKYPFYGSNVAEKLFEKGLCLPSGSNLADKDLERVVTNIKMALGV